MSILKEPRILILDDEPEVISLYGDLLSAQYKIVKNTSPMDALNDVQMNPKGFSLVISDYMMPGMSGEEFMKTLRNYKIEVPAILCTAKPELLQDFSLFKYVITKPFDLDDFLSKVESILEGGDPKKSADSTSAEKAS